VSRAYCAGALRPLDKPQCACCRLCLNLSACCSAQPQCALKGGRTLLL
jgi:hypothetical protein